MTHITYEIVEHEDGWAYKLGDVFSGTYGSHAEATDAAERAAEGHMQNGSDEVIEYEDEDGVWHEEAAFGDDRPDAVVEPWHQASDGTTGGCHGRQHEQP